MRLSKQQDVIRDITSKGGWSCGIKKIKFNNDLFKEETLVDFNPVINFLVGPNGVGKSRLLKKVFDKVLNCNKDNGVAVEYYGDGNVEEKLFVSSADVIETCRKYFSKIKNIEEGLLNGLSSVRYIDDDLEEAKWLVFKDYDFVDVFEVENFISFNPSSDDVEEIVEDSLDAIPFFRVKTGEIIYDTRSMGSGEYAALYIHWVLRRASEKSLLFFEEPETFLSFRVQNNISILFAKYALAKKSAYFISTHSYAIVRNYSDKFVKPLLFQGSKIKFAIRDSNITYNNIGAFYDSYRYIFVCEDWFSWISFNYILKLLFPREFNNCKVFWCAQFQDHPGGAPGLMKINKSIKSIKNFNSHLILVFDGDQKNDQGTFLNKDIDENDKLIYPEEDDMEVILRKCLGRNFDKLDSIDLEDAYHDSISLDKHEFFHEISKKCNLNSPESLIIKVLDIYLHENKDVMDYWIDKLRNLFLSKK